MATMQFTVTCRKCGQTFTTSDRDARRIHGSAALTAQGACPKVLGYILKCPHCAAENVARPEDGK